MGDLTDLGTALALIDKQIAARNPYNPFISTANTVGELGIKMAAQEPKRYKLGEVVGTSLLSGLLSGGLGSLSDMYTTRKKKAANQVLSSFITGRGAARPENLSQSVYEQAKEQGELIRANRVYEAVQDQLKRKYDLEDHFSKSLMGKSADLLYAPELTRAEMIARGELVPTGKSATEKTPGKTGKEGAVDGATSIVDQPEYTLGPNHPGLKAIRAIEDQSRGELDKSVGYFDVVKKSMDTMKNTYQFNDRPATLAFLQSFAKILDPTGTVKGEEFRNVANTQTFLAGLGYKLESLITGEQEINPVDKLRMLRAAGETHNQMGISLDSQVGKQKGLVKSRGGNPAAVFANVEYSPFDIIEFMQSPLAQQTTLEEQAANAGISLPTDNTDPVLSALEAEARRRGLGANPTRFIGEVD